MLQIRLSTCSTGPPGAMDTTGGIGGLFWMVTTLEPSSAPSRLPSFGVTQTWTRSPLSKWTRPSRVWPVCPVVTPFTCQS